jgi:hypothetical protein
MSKGTSVNPSERIDQHIAGIKDWRGPVLATIRRIMMEADPSVTEDWKWMGTPVWYCDGIVSLANPHKGKVKWTFAKGALFADADQLFNTGLEGNERRAIDFFENDRLDEAALRRLVRAAIAYNRSKLKSKKPVTAKKPVATKKPSRPSARRKK